MGADAPERDLVVMMSVKAVRPTTNPYIVQLLRGVGQRVTVHTFSWRRALFGRVDVFHVHWPDAVFGRDRRWKSEIWALVFAVALTRMRLAHVAIVRTIHNAHPHEGSTRLESAVLSMCDRATTVWIRLNPDTTAPAGGEMRTILHGHYREWFAEWPRAAQRHGRLLMFGQVRRYKGVLELLAAFGDVEDPGLELRVIGRPSPASFARNVEAVAAKDTRVSIDLRFIDDETLAAEIGASELVMLPYHRLHNSGAALLALSLDRAVLVPDGIETKRLAAEVGDGWVHRFGASVEGETDISSTDISRALESERRASAFPDSRSDRPDLSAREWDESVRQHIAVYYEAMDAVAAAPTRGHTRRRRGPTPR